MCNVVIHTCTYILYIYIYIIMLLTLHDICLYIYYYYYYIIFECARAAYKTITFNFYLYNCTHCYCVRFFILSYHYNSSRASHTFEHIYYVVTCILPIPFDLMIYIYIYSCLIIIISMLSMIDPSLLVRHSYVHASCKEFSNLHAMHVCAINS